MRTVTILKKQTRPLNLKETKTLKKIRSTARQALKRGFKVSRFLVAIIMGAAFAYLASWTKYDFLALVLGIIAAFSFAFVVFMPYEIYKDLRKAKSKIKEIDEVLAANAIDVFPMTAKRIAMAKEYEHEGDLYIVETSDGHILYMWDNGHNLKKNFPCLAFEIYDDNFHRIIGRQINPLSEKIKPLVINAKAKWAYLKKSGAPEHLKIEKKDFGKLVERMNNFT